MRRNLIGKKASPYLLMVMVYSLIFPVQIFALPQGGQVVAGEATITEPDALNMNIHQSTQKAIINWNQFSIAQPETVTFLQPNASAVALNRVITSNPSYIYGTLTANGQVFLINPAGILVGPSGVIDTSAFVGSTLDMADDDFLSGNYVFEQTLGSSLATIVNQGTIQAADGGFVSLLSPGIDNQGSIVANLGKVYLGGAERVVLNFAGNDLIGFELDGEIKDEVLGLEGEALGANIDNSGTITADGGQVVLSARTAYDAIKGVVNNDGQIYARSLVNNNGEIILAAGDNGTVVNSGLLNASGSNAGQTGGSIKVLGHTVKVFDGSTLNASGDQGGGEILIGGDYQGSNDNIQNAQYTIVEEDVSILADAGTDGDGGKVIVWADDTTEFHGRISARGGDLSGDGGFAEISGKKRIMVSGHADLRAPTGQTGTLLLDPGSIAVVSGGNTFSDWNTVNDGWINSQLIGSGLTLDTNSATGGGSEDVTFTGTSITLSNLLTVDAGDNITLGGSFFGAGGLTLTAGGSIDLGGSSFNVTGSAFSATVGSGQTFNINGATGLGTFTGGATVDGTSGSTASGLTNYNLTGTTDGNITYSNFTTINGTGQLDNLGTAYDDANDTATAGGVTYNGFATINGATAVTNVTSSYDVSTNVSGAGNTYGTASLLSVTGAAGSAVLDNLGASYDDSSASVTTGGITFTDFNTIDGATGVTNIDTSFDAVSGLSGSGRTFTDFSGTLSAAAAGSLTSAGGYDVSNNQISGVTYSNFTSVDGDSGVLSNLGAGYDDANDTATTGGITFSNFGTINGATAVTNVTSSYDVSTNVSGAGNTYGTASLLSVTGAAGSAVLNNLGAGYDDANDTGTAGGIAFSSFDTINGATAVTNVTSSYDVSTNISGAGNTYGTASLLSVTGAAGSAVLDNLGASYDDSSASVTTGGITFTDFNTIDGATGVTNIDTSFDAVSGLSGSGRTFTDFSGTLSAAAAGSLTSAGGYDVSNNQISGVTYSNFTSVDGDSGVLSNLGAGYDDANDTATTGGITFSNFGTINGATAVTNVTSSYDVSTNVSGAGNTYQRCHCGDQRHEQLRCID